MGLMDKKELRKCIHDCFQNIPFGTASEYDGLEQLGELLAVPKKGVENYKHYYTVTDEETGDAWTEPVLAEYEEEAKWEAASLACSLVYRNVTSFEWDDTKNLPDKILHELMLHNIWNESTSNINTENYINYIKGLLKPMDSDGFRYKIQIGRHTSYAERWLGLRQEYWDTYNIQEIPWGIHPLIYTTFTRFEKLPVYIQDEALRKLIRGLKSALGVTHSKKSRMIYMDNAVDKS